MAEKTDLQNECTDKFLLRGKCALNDKLDVIKMDIQANNSHRKLSDISVNEAILKAIKDYQPKYT